LIMAFAASHVEVRGVTTVVGGMLDVAAARPPTALYTRSFADRACRCYGKREALKRVHLSADGFTGGMDWGISRESRAAASGKDGSDAAIIECRIASGNRDVTPGAADLTVLWHCRRGRRFGRALAVACDGRGARAAREMCLPAAEYTSGDDPDCGRGCGERARPGRWWFLAFVPVRGGSENW